MSESEMLSMRDLMDNQLETADGRMIGRVADVEAEWRDGGELVLANLVTGPQALAGRVAHWLEVVMRFVFRGRFERTIPTSEIEGIGPTIKLRGRAEEYLVGQSDRWIARHILRYIPWSGYW